MGLLATCRGAGVTEEVDVKFDATVTNSSLDKHRWPVATGLDRAALE